MMMNDEWWMMMMMDDGWWMMNDEWWWMMMMNDDGWWWWMMDHDDEWWWWMMNDDWHMCRYVGQSQGGKAGHRLASRAMCIAMAFYCGSWWLARCHTQTITLFKQQWVWWCTASARPSRRTVSHPSDTSFKNAGIKTRPSAHTSQRSAKC